jgi:hypothetical protein
LKILTPKKLPPKRQTKVGRVTPRAPLRRAGDCPPCLGLPPKRQTAQEYLELQRLMASSVMLPLAPDGGMRAQSPLGRPMREVAAGFIKPNDRLSSLERLEIYNRQYWFRLKDCFYDDYPGLRAVLGDRRFERLACAYLERYPSESFTLRNLGRRLIAFLKADPKWAAPQNRLCLEMAQLEWAHIQAFDNEARPPLEIDSLAGKDPARLRLRLQPHISLLRLRYELDRFLIQIKRAEGGSGQASNALQERRAHLRRRLKRQLRTRTLFLAVHRYQETVYYKRLELGQFRLLSVLQANGTMAQACEAAFRAADAPHDLGNRIKVWFETWASLGWFCRPR